MPGQSAYSSASRRRAGSSKSGRLTVLLALVMIATSLVPVDPARVARASVMAADAADYVPTVANLPPGYREESADAVGGDIEPTISLRRSFVSADGNQRVVVDVRLGTSEQDAHTTLGNRMNQLIRYQGWRITPNAPFGESGFRGTGPTPEGATSAMIAFRVRAVAAEVNATSRNGNVDVSLLDNLARLVERRINSDPEAVAAYRGWPVEPVEVPGKDPVIPAAVAVGPGGFVPPGAQVTGSSSGSPIAGDTVVNLTVTGFERPWQAGGSLPRPSNGLEYLTVEVQIDVYGQTEVVVAQTDFWVSTFDGRSWTPLTGRSPALLAGSIVNGTPSRGWLTFAVTQDQPALQLTWRIRTRQALNTQGNTDQTLVIPLTVGAMASANVGESAPPPSAPVVPPSSAPSGPTGPAGPSGPSAPSAPTSPGG